MLRNRQPSGSAQVIAYFARVVAVDVPHHITQRGSARAPAPGTGGRPAGPAEGERSVWKL